MRFFEARARVLPQSGLLLLLAASAASAAPLAGDPLYAGSPLLGKVSRSLLTAAQRRAATATAVEVVVTLRRLTQDLEARAR